MVNRILHCVLALLLTAFACADDSRDGNAHFVNSHDPPFTLEVPSEFLEMPQEWLESRPRAICGFYEAESNQAEGPSGVRVVLERLGGTIGRDSEEDRDALIAGTKRTLPPGAVVTAERVRAMGFDLTGLLATFTIAGHDMTSFGVQVPFKEEAVQITIVAPSGKEDRIKQVAEGLLASVRGESNWSQEAEGVWPALEILIQTV